MKKKSVNRTSTPDNYSEPHIGDHTGPSSEQPKADQVVVPLRRTDDLEKPEVLNADNKVDEPQVAMNRVNHEHIGEVDGIAATTVPFTPTFDELMEVAKYWATLMLVVDYFNFVRGSDDIPECEWVSEVAFGRVLLIRDVIGAEMILQAIEQANAEFRRSVSLTARQFNTFQHCDYQHLFDELWNAGNVSVRKVSQSRRWREIRKIYRRTQDPPMKDYSRTRHD